MAGNSIRLLNTKSLRVELVPFIPDGGTLYAILSHRWYKEGREDVEVVYEDLAPRGEAYHEIANIKSEVRKRKQASLLKLKFATDEAKQRGLKYIWIDTVCINSSNREEKHNSIASMYEWYKESAVCFVFLHDVTFQRADYTRLASDTQSISNRRRIFERGKSEWFERSWTLQELIASKNRIIFNDRWSPIGNIGRLPHNRWLATMIEGHTGIPAKYLRGRVDLDEIPIATRLLWASNRTATKPEDEAYALAGIFKVRSIQIEEHIGKERAFQRLLAAIIKANPRDESIFAWSGKERTSHLMASSPANYGWLKAYNPADLRMKEAFEDYARLTDEGLEVAFNTVKIKPPAELGQARHVFRVYLDYYSPARPGTKEKFASFLIVDKKGTNRFTRFGKTVMKAKPGDRELERWRFIVSPTRQEFIDEWELLDCSSLEPELALMSESNTDHSEPTGPLWRRNRRLSSSDSSTPPSRLSRLSTSSSDVENYIRYQSSSDVRERISDTAHRLWDALRGVSR